MEERQDKDTGNTSSPEAPRQPTLPSDDDILQYANQLLVSALDASKVQGFASVGLAFADVELLYKCIGIAVNRQTVINNLNSSATAVVTKLIEELHRVTKETQVISNSAATLSSSVLEFLKSNIRQG